MNTDQWNADVCEETILEHVVLLGLVCFMGWVIKLHPQHWHPVFLPADEEVHVLLTDFVEGTQFLRVLNEIREPGLAEDLAAPLAQLL